MRWLGAGPRSAGNITTANNASVAERHSQPPPIPDVPPEAIEAVLSDLVAHRVFLTGPAPRWRP